MSSSKYTSKTRSPGATSTIVPSDIGHGHASRSHRHNYGRDGQGSSAQPFADASNSLTRVDPDERRRKMHVRSPPPGFQQRDVVLLQGAAGTPPNTVRRGRKSHEQRSTRRSFSTPAGGNQNQYTRKDAMQACHPAQPFPPGQSWYIRRRDSPHPKSKLDAKVNQNLKPTPHRRASSGSVTSTDVKTGTGVMRGWYTAVRKRFGAVDADSEGVPLLKSES